MCLRAIKTKHCRQRVGLYLSSARSAITLGPSGSTLLVLRQSRVEDLCFKEISSFQNLRRKGGKFDHRAGRPDVVYSVLFFVDNGLTFVLLVPLTADTNTYRDFESGRLQHCTTRPPEVSLKRVWWWTRQSVDRDAFLCMQRTFGGPLSLCLSLSLSLSVCVCVFACVRRHKE